MSQKDPVNDGHYQVKASFGIPDPADMNPFDSLCVKIPNGDGDLKYDQKAQYHRQ
jgi:hypothetical protein